MKASTLKRILAVGSKWTATNPWRGPHDLRTRVVTVVRHSKKEIHLTFEHPLPEVGTVNSDLLIVPPEYFSFVEGVLNIYAAGLKLSAPLVTYVPCSKEP